MSAVLQNENKNSRGNFWLWLALVSILLGDAGAWLVQTDFGKVEVSGFTLPTENGQWIAADLFRPNNATAQNPVPLVVVCPGFERSKETMTSYSIELARRGIAVVTIDPYNQGASSTTLQKRSASVEGYGVIPMVEHVCASTNFDFVDKSRIGAAGYSAGGNAVLQSAARFGAQAAKAARHGKNSEAENKIFAVFIGGYILTLTDKTLDTLNANVGLDYARYDEGAFRSEIGTADLRTAPESLRLVNTIFPEDQQISAVEIGKYYGNVTNRTLRVIQNTRSIHPLMPYAPAHITKMIDFFTTAFGVNPEISSSRQIWPLKEFFTLLSLIGGFLFLVPFARLLLCLKFFSSLAQPVPPPLPAPKRTGKIIFWSTFIFSALAACFLFIPCARRSLTWFLQASAAEPTWFFPQRINNAILLWAVANGLLGLLIFFATYFLFGRKIGVTPAMWGLKIKIADLIKTILLALILFAAFYALVFSSYKVFHTDFRFTFISAAAAFPAKMWLVALEYIPPFLIFYFANSVRVNAGNRFAGQSERAGIFIGALGNSVGLILILAIQYVHLAATGQVFWTQEWLYTNLLLGVTPMMFVLPIFNRLFFRRTGRVYLGPLVTCPIFIMMMLTGNVCYIPLK
jgi:dienelactone hydrolase